MNHSFACFFSETELGKSIVGCLSTKLAVHTAVSITKRAFLGDSDCRAVIDMVYGPVDWYDIMSGYKLRDNYYGEEKERMVPANLYSD